MLSVDSAELGPVRVDLALHFEYESVTVRCFAEGACTLERSSEKYKDSVNRPIYSLSVTTLFYRTESICVNRSLL